jgi:hypothetical protein
VRHMPGAQVRRAGGWATRITVTEVAATNRRARFPAAQRVGVLRIASAPTLLAPRTHQADTTGLAVPRLQLVDPPKKCRERRTVNHSDATAV